MDTPLMQPPVVPSVPLLSYAGFWRRLIAWFIDNLILSAATMIILIPFLAMAGIGFMSMENYEQEEPPIEMIIAFAGAYLMLIILLTAAQWLYFALMESQKGATFGKMALGIKVTDLNGNRISFGRATGRYFGKILSTSILLVGFMMAGWTQQKQALHDILSGCLVVNRQ